MSYIEWRKSQNICKVSIPNKEKYYMDIENIENSFSGNICNWNITNAFIMESAQLLINAMELFEQGYFDCAFYSLRETIELSTIMVYLVDMPSEQRETKLNDWKDLNGFPMKAQMLKQLEVNGNIYIDIKNKMPSFFNSARQVSYELNKYVHKQGLKNLYVSRNHIVNANKSRNDFIETFEYYLKKCIGIVAVMRLIIDPFPVLLIDEEILFRCFDSLTEPYTEDFVEEYIGLDTIDSYKQTEFYLTMYEYFLQNEKKSQSAFDVMKYLYIDSNKLDEIINQLHLLTKDDAICVLLTSSNRKIVKIYTQYGLSMYSTDRKTNRIAQSWKWEDFCKFTENKQKINQAYDEAYITPLEFDYDIFFIEHNEIFTNTEVENIKNIVTQYLMKLKEDKE